MVEHKEIGIDSSKRDLSNKIIENLISKGTTFYSLTNNIWNYPNAMLVKECKYCIINNHLYIRTKVKHLRKRKITKLIIVFFDDEGINTKIALDNKRDMEWREQNSRVLFYKIYHYGTFYYYETTISNPYEEQCIDLVDLSINMKGSLQFVSIAIHEKSHIQEDFYTRIDSFTQITPNEIAKIELEQISSKVSKAYEGTSLQEQAIYYYVKRHFTDAISRYKIDNLIEVDIYIPSKMIAIEYDGFHWHKSRKESDEYKNLFLNRKGIYLLRVREAGLPELSTFNGFTIMYDTKTTAFVSVINTVVGQIEYRGCISPNYGDTPLNNEQFENDLPEIYSNLYTKPVEHSIADYSGIEFWDHEKNRNLNPKNIPLSFRKNLYFKCLEGHVFYTSPSCFIYDSHSLKEKEKYRRLCPNMRQCEYDCPIIRKYICDNIYNKRDDFPDDLKIMLANSESSKHVVHDYFSSVISVDRDNNFRKVFLKTNPSNSFTYFVGSTIRWVTNSFDLELIKVIIKKYNAIVFLDYSYFDNNNQSIASLFEYFDWCSKNDVFQNIRAGFIGNLLHNNVSINMARELRLYIDRHNDEFKHDNDFIDLVDNYILINK